MPFWIPASITNDVGRVANPTYVATNDGQIANRLR